MPLQDGDLFLIDNNKKVVGENLFSGSYDDKWMMIQDGANTYKVKVGDLCDKAAANRYCLVNRGATSYKALVSDVCDTFKPGGGPGGRPEVPWDKVLWMVNANYEKGLFGKGTLVENRGLTGVGDNVFLGTLPSNDQHGYSFYNNGSGPFTFNSESQGSISFAAVPITDNGQTFVARSTSKFRMSSAVETDTKSTGYLDKGWYGTKQRFHCSWIFHGAQIVQTNAKTRSSHSGHTALDSEGLSESHSFTIPCSNSGNTATCFIVMLLGGGRRDDIEAQYSPPPKFGGLPYSRGYAGPRTSIFIELCETDLGFNGDIEAKIKATGPCYAVCVYWTVSYS